MIDYIRYRVTLRRLSKRKKKIRAAYAKDLISARATSKNMDELRSLESEAWFEESMVDEEIALLVTDYLVSKAGKHFIATPSRKEEVMWEQCNKISERFFLTNAGVSALRSTIRAEARERRDLILPIIAVLIGVIGTITGLIAFWKK